MSTSFGPYRLFEEIGRGGSGVVHRARRDGAERDVALKQLTTGTRASDEDRQAFLRGAHTAAELDHPHIVSVRDIGEADGCPYFTMQLVEGRSLAFVIDFGSARRKLKPEAGSWSQPPGLTHYMAPEQALGQRGQDSADIWSLGVILYELLTDCVPYEGHGYGDPATELTSSEPVTPPRSRDPHVHPYLELVCLKCLQKRPERRYRCGGRHHGALFRAHHGRSRAERARDERFHRHRLRRGPPHAAA